MSMTSSLRSVLRVSNKSGNVSLSTRRELSTQCYARTCRASPLSMNLRQASLNASRAHATTLPIPLVHKRTMGNPAAPQGTLSDIPIDTYHKVSDHTMEQLHEKLEELIDVEGDPAYEVDYHSGVLTLILGPRGTYVINKQPPNKQIWLSSPVSGPKRYDITPSGEWTYLRDGVTLETLLNTELGSAFTQQKVEFDLRIPAERLGIWKQD